MSPKPYHFQPMWTQAPISEVDPLGKLDLVYV